MQDATSHSIGDGLKRVDRKGQHEGATEANLGQFCMRVYPVE